MDTGLIWNLGTDMWSKNSLFAIVAGSSLLSGCANYLNNWDSITLGAGNAVEANLGIHAINPFPASANNTDIDIDSGKVQQAYGRYIVPGDDDVVTGGSTSGDDIITSEK